MLAKFKNLKVIFPLPVEEVEIAGNAEEIKEVVENLAVMML